jgi:HD-GYP domain-containing protein (c-di-GMP phosphodiesterase class II)
MQTVSNFLTDTSFLEKFFSYLETCHGVHAYVVDKDGRTDLLGGQVEQEYAEKKLYPIDHCEDIGGIRCSAETRQILDAAAPHIQICMDGLQRLFEKALVMQQSMEEILRLSDQLHFLSGLAVKLSGIRDPERCGALVLQETAQEIGADAAFIQIQGRKGSQHIVPYQIAALDIRTIRKDPELFSVAEGKTAVIELQNGMSCLMIPIREKDGPTGQMVFLRKPGKRVFTSYEKQFAGIIDSIISPTMETLRLYHSLHVLYLNTVKALAAAIDAKDAYTHGHSFRVARYSVAIGRQLSLGELELPDLEIAAYMHDLGKIGVPEAVLAKPGKLSAAEFEEIKKHPLLTNKILEPIDLPIFIINATLQHHERLDGRGYPMGLKGDEISLYAKIIAVADVFDALTSARPYRAAMTVEDALTILCDGIDTEYDRNVVRAFFTALRDKETDRDIAVVYGDLKFMQIEQMNQFLQKITGHLLAQATELPGGNKNFALPEKCAEINQAPAR